MTEATRVELTVLGERLTLRTTESPEYLRSLAAFLEERVASLGAASRGSTTAVLLAALDIVDELFRLRAEQSRADGAVDARLRSLLGELERVTPRQP
jgi:cell division protein ZapA (FtsZ GTPase activity inhibitor)